jgi:hypothetical protein
VEQSICLFWKRGSLLHQSVTQGQVEVKCAFAERFRQCPIMCIVEVIVELEANSEHGICRLVASLPHVEQGLAEISAQLQSGHDLSAGVLVATVVQILAQSPARSPGMLLDVSSAAREMEHPMAVVLT